MLHNGKDLLASYKAANPVAQETATAQQQIDTNMSPDDWMKKLLSSEDSGVGNKSEEQKMQAATDAAISKTVDLTSMFPNLKECSIMLNDGKPLLQVNNGIVNFSHELTNAEMTRIQQALGNANLSDAEKQRTIASVINGIVVSQQMSQNYQQGVETQQNQQEAVQRK